MSRGRTLPSQVHVLASSDKEFGNSSPPPADQLRRSAFQSSYDVCNSSSAIIASEGQLSAFVNTKLNPLGETNRGDRSCGVSLVVEMDQTIHCRSLNAGKPTTVFGARTSMTSALKTIIDSGDFSTPDVTGKLWRSAENLLGDMFSAENVCHTASAVTRSYLEWVCLRHAELEYGIAIQGQFSAALDPLNTREQRKLDHEQTQILFYFIGRLQIISWPKRR